MPKPLTIEIFEVDDDDPRDRYCWRAVAANGTVLAESEQGYARRADASKAGNFLVRLPHEDAETKVLKETA